MGKTDRIHPKRTNVKTDTLSPESELPLGIKLVAWSRMVRWIGWGFGEALIPIFIFTFSHTFAEAGLFRSVIDVTGLLMLPIVGMWVDRTSARRLILISLLIYPLVGVSYFLAGAFGLAIFIILARAINGIAWQMEDVGVGTYYRRLSPKGIISSAFGFIDTWANLGWILAALTGIVLLAILPIHVLLLAIAPFAILAFFVVRRAPRDHVANEKNLSVASFGIIAPYKETLILCSSWSRHLWFLCALSVFSGIIGVLMWFFIPIDAYAEGAQPGFVVLLSIIGTIPSLFGYAFGKIADKSNKYFLLSVGLIAVALVMTGLALFPSFAFKMVASFLLGVLLELFSVVERGLITTFGTPERYGEQQSAFDSLTTLAGLGSPLLVGVMIDELGFAHAAVVFAGIATFFALNYFLLRKRVPKH
ncbi:MAG: MFS transporter [Candidatus Pacebacteria bacterium]|jgi:MFS family permease|nr:MFS transporter [Candidatus Paceibacterota bacterium]